MSTYVAAIDLGTTKVVTIIGEKTDNGRFRILAYDEAESSGIRRGQVENIQHVIEAITPTIESVRQNTNISMIDEVFVGIAGQHIRCIENRADCTRDNYDTEITDTEVRQLENSMYKIRMEPGEEVLHVIPQHYNVDDALGVNDPVGRLGQRLSANFHIIIGKASSAKHTELCIERVGLKLQRLILEPLASARAVLTEDEKEVGVVMVDMGGGTTDLVVYYDNVVRHTAVIPFGGNIITEDIKKGCGILHRQAEQIKLQYGSCLASMAADNKVIAVPGIAGREQREIAFKSLANIIEARLSEIIDMVMFEINRSGYANKLAAGIVFTGGGAQMTHLPQFIKLKTGMDIRIGKPEYIASNSAKDILQPKFSTAAGLIMCGFDFMEGKGHEHLAASANMVSVDNQKDVAPVVTEVTATPQSTATDTTKKRSIMQHVLGFFEESRDDQV